LFFVNDERAIEFFLCFFLLPLPHFFLFVLARALSFDERDAWRAREGESNNSARSSSQSSAPWRQQSPRRCSLRSLGEERHHRRRRRCCGANQQVPCFAVLSCAAAVFRLALAMDSTLFYLCGEGKREQAGKGPARENQKSPTESTLPPSAAPSLPLFYLSLALSVACSIELLLHGLLLSLYHAAADAEYRIHASKAQEIKTLFSPGTKKTIHSFVIAAALASTSSSSPSRGYTTDLAPYSALRSSLGERGGSGGRSSVSEFEKYGERERERERKREEKRGSDDPDRSSEEKKTRPFDLPRPFSTLTHHPPPPPNQY